MEKYRLKQWYPNLHLAWSTTDNYEYDREINRMYNRTRWGTIPITAPYLHPDFWELIEEKEPLFVTEDGVELFDKNINFIVVDCDFEKFIVSYVELVKPLNTDKFIYFAHESNADEYILWNKPLLSLNDIDEIIEMYTHEFEELIKLAKEGVRNEVRIL